MLKTWFIAMRPWSFTAAFVPIAVGTALAWAEGTFNAGTFLLALFGGICMQAGTNLINTYGDYMAGVDTVDSAITCPQLVTGVLTPSSMKKAGCIAFFIAGLVGLYLAYLCGAEVLIVGVIGLLGGYCYTAGISPYKYKGLGPLFVFVLMGPLMTWPAYFIQTGKYSIMPILIAMPIGFLVTGIMHANDIRDITQDRKAGIKTLAMILGFQNSVNLYYLLYIAAYLCLIILAVKGLLPWTALLPLVLMPIVINIFTRVRAAVNKGTYHQFSKLDCESAGFHFQFGLLLILGLIVSPYVNRWGF